MRKALTVIALLIGTALCAASQQSPPCSLANVAGDWAFRNYSKTPDGDFNGVGAIHITKDGSITGHGWFTVGGAVSSEFFPVGTVTVTADCLSTGTFEGTPPYHCVIFDNRMKMWCVYEAPSAFTVTLEKIGRP
jgi:hypothetical protein